MYSIGLFAGIEYQMISGARHKGYISVYSMIEGCKLLSSRGRKVF